ncbi:MAG: sugar phosphate isomerase/epimerase family protein [Armatimonadota bacterium]
MKFSICNELFDGWNFEDVCRVVSEIGYAGIEIAPFTLGTSVDKIDEQTRKYVREKSQQYGLEIVGLHWLLAKTNGLHVTHPDRLVRERTVKYLNKLVKLCAELGGTVMVFGSPAQRNIVDDVDYAEAWSYALDTFRQVLPMLEKYGVVICLEPLSPEETNFITSAREAAEMIEQVGSENFRLLLDVKAMSSEQMPIPEIICKYGGLLRHFHANDANKRGPGFGDTDFVPIAKALKSVNYAGWVSVEVFDFAPDPVTIAQQSLEYLRGVFV